MAFRPADLVRGCLKDRSANVATMTALIVPMALVATAVAIDEGALYTQRRAAQSLVDLAAISAASRPGKAEEAVLAALDDNGVADVLVLRADGTINGSALPTAAAEQARVRITPGRYTPSGTLTVSQRFEGGKQPYNAVQVHLERKGLRHFGGALVAAPTIRTQAIASVTPQAAFSVGSRLARLDGGVLNGLLGALVGGNLSLSVMDYEALLAAEVSLFGFLEQLAGQANLQAASYADVLKTDARIGDIARAMAAVPGLDSRAKAALLATAASASAAVTVPLSHVVDLGTAGKLTLGDRPPGLAASVNVMDLLTTMAGIANGRNQVHVDLGASVPGLLAATLDLAIGEPVQSAPMLRVGETGTVVRTAQTRARITVELLGPGGLLGTSIKLPIYVQLASAEAQLSSVTCPTGRPDSVRVVIGAKPGIAQIRVADVNGTALRSFTSTPAFAPATIVKAPLVSVTGSSLLEIANSSSTDLTFMSKDIADGAVKSVSTRNVTQSLAASLLGKLELQFNILAIGINLKSLLSGALTTTLSAATPAIDDLLHTVLSTLGLRVGEADVRVSGASCGRSVLVQ